MRRSLLSLLYLLVFIDKVISQTEGESKASTDSNDSSKKYLVQLQAYKNAFKLKRSHQMEAAESIIKIQDYSKQYKLISVVLEKIFRVLEEARVELISSGYIPGQQFPEEEKHKEALGNVVENTVFFGDILLRSPDTTYKIFSKNPEWRVTSKWSISFVSETGILDDMDSKLLELMKQELKLVPKDPNYINPYREKNKAKKLAEEKEKEEAKEKRKNEKKKKKKKGPKLSSHGEL